jgi:hypothetical protein
MSDVTFAATTSPEPRSDTIKGSSGINLQVSGLSSSSAPSSKSSVVTSGGGGGGGGGGLGGGGDGGGGLGGGGLRGGGLRGGGGMGGGEGGEGGGEGDDGYGGASLLPLQNNIHFSSSDIGGGAGGGASGGGNGGGGDGGGGNGGGRPGGGGGGLGSSTLPASPLTSSATAVAFKGYDESELPLRPAITSVSPRLVNDSRRAVVSLALRASAPYVTLATATTLPAKSSTDMERAPGAMDATTSRYSAANAAG